MKWLNLSFLVSAALAVSGPVAALVEVSECYQTVHADAILTADLSCDTGALESVAIEIAASDVTLDLAGHTLSGHPLGIGIRIADRQGVTVRNGTVLNFAVGIDINQSAAVTVENMSVKNLVEDDPEVFLPGIRMTRSTGVMVSDSYFEMLWVSHKEMIVMASSEATITRSEFINGSVGINVSGDGGVGNLGSIATITDNRFVRAEIACVLIQFSNNARIAGNEFYRCERGVMADLHGENWITGITIESNWIHEGFVGILFLATNDSRILDNDIRNTWRGVFLDANMGCTEVPTCYYSTGNLVSGNRALGSIVDLYHHELAVGNSWEDNFCRSKEGDEIPECTGIYLDGFEGPSTLM